MRKTEVQLSLVSSIYSSLANQGGLRIDPCRGGGGVEFHWNGFSFFQPTSRCLDILMKHSFSCLIYYFFHKIVYRVGRNFHKFLKKLTDCPLHTQMLITMCCLILVLFFCLLGYEFDEMASQYAGGWFEHSFVGLLS